MSNKTIEQKSRDCLVSLGVNPAPIEKRNLPLFEDAKDLVIADISQSGREHLLIQDASDAWSKLKSKAQADGVSLIIVSAFRSFERQVEIVQHSLDQGEDAESLFKTSAPPGYSEHHSGRAIDIGTMGCAPLTEAFGETDAYTWLVENASSFGFRLSYPKNNQYGFKYEPWHWFYEGFASIREIDVSDIETLQAIGIKTFSETFDSTNTKEDMEAYVKEGFNLEKLKQELSNPKSEFYFAELSGVAIGYLKTNVGTAQTGQFSENALEIERIYVVKEFHGKRVGKLLFDLALQIAKQNKNKRVWLGVWEKNTKAINFYEQQGFERFDTHIFQLGDDAQTDWLMKLDL